MADRNQKISMYVTEERKKEIEQRAEEEDTSISAYLNRLVGRQLIREAEDEIASETRAAEHIQEIIDRGARQLRDATDDLRQMQAIQGTYTIANFEFLKQSQGEPAINDALSTGSRRLRQETDPIETEPAPASNNGETESGLDIDALREQ